MPACFRAFLGDRAPARIIRIEVGCAHDVHTSLSLAYHARHARAPQRCRRCGQRAPHWRVAQRYRDSRQMARRPGEVPL